VRRIIRLAAIAVSVLLGGCTCSFALNPSLDISQYGHKSWTRSDGFSVGNIFAIAQTSDGYLWLGGDFGLFRFDGVNAVPWQPPGQRPSETFVFRLLGARDGTLWIGTFESLSNWNGTTLIRHPEFDGRTIGSLLEDREGTVWAGTWGTATPAARLCAMRGRETVCYGDDGRFGKAVGSLYEDSFGTLWVSAETGLWRWKPGPQRLSAISLDGQSMSQSADGRTIVANYGKGVMQLAGSDLEPFPIHSPRNSNQLLPNAGIDANKLLRDRDGGLWIGTVERGLIHIHNGRTDVFTKAEGLSGDVILSLFEDREGNIWVSTIGGIDRFREAPITNMTTAQGLASDSISSVLAATDGSVWIATHDGMTRWNRGQTTTFGEANGLPDNFTQSLFQDDSGRIWVFTHRGLAYFDGRRFIALKARLPSDEVYSITGDPAGNLWLSGNKGLSHLVAGRPVETFPWSALGRKQQAKVIVAANDGLWLSFWNDGGVEYFKDGRVQQSYNASNGLGMGHVPGLRLDEDGAVWAATQDGGLSRIKDGHIITLATRNGLPCDNIHWSMEDDDRSLWLYTVCGVVRIARSQIDAWIANPSQRIETTLWDASDGVKLGVVAPSSFGPTVAKSGDGRLWFLTGEGLSVVDPRHLSTNTLPPPVHIERVVADKKTWWQNLPGMVVSSFRLPAHTHDLQIYYTALSLVSSRKVHFKYRLEGQDPEWREVVNDRDVQYSNLGPGTYRFHVIACNNSGVWNQQGDTLEFSIDPAYYQTNWFRALCAVLVLLLVWAIYQFRVRQLHRQFALTLDARVAERTSIARELHDTLLQSFHGLMLRFEIVSQLLPERPVEAKDQLDRTIERAAQAITEGRDAVQGLRASTVETNDLAQAINTLGGELAAVLGNPGNPAFRVTVEGEPRDLHPILRDEIYRIASEAMRNAFRHAQARQVEVEIRYDDRQFRLRVRDDGKGMDTAVLSGEGREGHYGLRGMRERAPLIGGKLAVWSEVGTGTEVELIVPASSAYATVRSGSWLAQKFAGKA
jgi:signal transduction histidine kinase/ligand-binding sensor domain-containing protein